MTHVRLSKIATHSVKNTATEAADKAWEEGASPRAQLDAARAASGQELGYVSHQGAKQRAKALERMRKKNGNEK